MTNLLLNTLAVLLFVTLVGYVLYEQRHRIRDWYTCYRLNKRTKAATYIASDVEALTGFNRQQLAAYKNLPQALQASFIQLFDEANTVSAHVLGYMHSQNSQQPVHGLGDTGNLPDALAVLATHIGRDLTHNRRGEAVLNNPHSQNAQYARSILLACAERYGISELTRRLCAA